MTTIKLFFRPSQALAWAEGELETARGEIARLTGELTAAHRALTLADQEQARLVDQHAARGVALAAAAGQIETLTRLVAAGGGVR